MRRLPLFVLPLLTGLSLVPAPAAAQGHATPPDGITRTEDDLGTWDAVMVARSPFGRVFSERGVEINTRGCDGTCIVTKLKGVLAPRNGGSRPWWQEADARVVDRRTGMNELVSANTNTEVAPGEATSIAPRRAFSTGRVTAVGPRTSRTSVEYPSEGHRIVTVYVQQPDGTEVMVQRITYTRRK
jgi:hypothetical protein